MRTTNKPKIEIKIGPGGLYYAVDPKTGATSTSPSYNGLRQELETARDARDRADRQQTEREQEKARRMAEGAERVAVLAPKLKAAQQKRDDAYQQFREAALTGGAYIEAYARWVVLHRRAGALKINHNDARHEAQFGQDRRGASVEARTPPLAEALQTVVDDRVEELRAEVAA